MTGSQDFSTLFTVTVLNQSCWQSLGGQHGKGVDWIFEKVSLQTAFENMKKN